MWYGSTRAQAKASTKLQLSIIDAAASAANLLEIDEEIKIRKLDNIGRFLYDIIQICFFNYIIINFIIINCTIRLYHRNNKRE